MAGKLPASGIGHLLSQDADQVVPVVFVAEPFPEKTFDSLSEIIQRRERGRAESYDDVLSAISNACQPYGPWRDGPVKEQDDGGGYLVVGKIGRGIEDGAKQLAVEIGHDEMAQAAFQKNIVRFRPFVAGRKAVPFGNGAQIGLVQDRIFFALLAMGGDSEHRKGIPSLAEGDSFSVVFFGPCR